MVILYDATLGGGDTVGAVSQCGDIIFGTLGGGDIRWR